MDKSGGKEMVAKTPPMGWNSWDCYGAAVTRKPFAKTRITWRNI